MATRRIRFAAGTDGPVLPRSSNAGGIEKPRNDKRGVITSVTMIAALIGTVYLISRNTSNLQNSSLGSTGEGEGLEDFMFSHEQHDIQHDRHEYRTARQHHPDTHAHNLADSQIDDDGSIIVKTPDHPHAIPAADHAHTATAKEASTQHAAPAMPPAQAVGTHSDSSHHATGSAAGIDHSKHGAADHSQHHSDHQDVQHDVQHGVQQEAHHDVQHDAHNGVQQAVHHGVQQDAHNGVQQEVRHDVQQDTHNGVHHDVHAASSDVLPDPAEDPGMPHHQHDHPAHAVKVTGLTPPSGLYTLTATDIDGRERHLSEFAGKVTMVVNVASKCGYTDMNYKGLQEAYNKYHAHGFEILAFPSNEFGSQEPGTAAEIKEFCTSKYHTTFPMFAKVHVNGAQAHPVYQFLKSMLPVEQGGGGGVSSGKDIGWNFYKFLVDREGHPVKLFHQDWHQGVIEHAVYEMLVDPLAQ